MSVIISADMKAGDTGREEQIRVNSFKKLFTIIRLLSTMSTRRGFEVLTSQTIRVPYSGILVPRSHVTVLSNCTALSPRTQYYL
jgi:hypothetical protein